MNIAYQYNRQSSNETIAAAHGVAQRHAVSLVDYRSGSVVQRRLRDAMNSHTHTASQNVFQFKANSTGLPDNLKTGIENLSGHSMDDVKVHYHSSKPAQLNAHAYAQGNQIHVAPGQEKHLAHEAWHVVQQKQGRVQPTMQMKGRVNVNDDKGLEQEADLMGAKAMSMGFVTQRASTGRVHYHYSPVAQLRNITEIAYQQSTLSWRATNNPGHGFQQQPVGINTSAFIDPEDPEAGERTGAAPAGSIYVNGGGHYQNQNNGQNLTQGHLLNANLGGKAQPFNLFPISSEMNRLHSTLVEDPVKFMVLRVDRERRQEGSITGAPFAPAPFVPAAGLARGDGRAAVRASPAVALAQMMALMPAIGGAVNGFFPAVAGGVPPAVTAAMVPVAADNTAFLVHRIILAAGGVAGMTALNLAMLANAIAGAVGGAVGATIVPLLPAANVAPNAVAAAGVLTAGVAPVGGAPAIPGIAGAPFRASPVDISNAFASTPAGVALPAGGAGFNWNNVRVFYRVHVTAPGVDGGVMQPNNFRNEIFHCQAGYTLQDGISPNPALPHINSDIQAPLNLNNELGALNFNPAAAPAGLVVGPALALPGGGAGGGVLNAPSQHNILDGGGNIVGHATLFNQA